MKGSRLSRSHLKIDYIDWLFYLVVSLHFLFSIFLLSYSARAWIDPVEKTEGSEKSLTVISPVKDSFTENLPTKILIPKIALEENILNPDTIENSILEQYLGKGILRYPISGSAREGNMLILGHSSHLPNIRNTAFKKFNEINKLEPGDQIIVWTKDNKAHIYFVKNVRKVDSTETSINFSSEEPMLTLSTCNTLGKAEERILVEAQKIT